jgi:hypothetical protein
MWGHIFNRRQQFQSVLLHICPGKHGLDYLKWLAIASVAIGLPVILLRALAGLRRGLLDINILMTVAVAGKRDQMQLAA